ncbi:MAG: hypothetical protein IPJ76_01355 [Flavobacteriales bacterium]|nr:MAG: hypothetical protein IPJ76_01355 [Flavobacteriales bacterium]
MAQERVTTFGLQVKPVFPLSFFKPLTAWQEGALNGEVELQGGIAFGGVVRAGLTNMLSLEVGINQIQRNYRWSLTNDTTALGGGNTIKWVGYEIPVQGLVYVRLGERTWMNAAAGASADMYPTDAVENDVELRTFWFRNNWLQAAVVANLGFEYRTPKSGYFYLGASYHRPFGEMAIAEHTMRINGGEYSTRQGIVGTYLTFDVRYFFHEDPERRGRRNRN